MMDVTHGLPKVFHIYSPSRGKGNSCLNAFAGDEKRRYRETRDAHKPTVVTNAVRMTTGRLSVRSGPESHEESCAKTRPASRPCTKRPMIPGEGSLIRPCTSVLAPNNAVLIMESDMKKGSARRQAGGPHTMTKKVREGKVATQRKSTDGLVCI